MEEKKKPYWKLKKRERRMMTIWLFIACMMALWPFYMKRIKAEESLDVSARQSEVIQIVPLPGTEPSDVPAIDVSDNLNAAKPTSEDIGEVSQITEPEIVIIAAVYSVIGISAIMIANKETHV